MILSSSGRSTTVGLIKRPLKHPVRKKAAAKRMDRAIAVPRGWKGRGLYGAWQTASRRVLVGEEIAIDVLLRQRLREQAYRDAENERDQQAINERIKIQDIDRCKRYAGRAHLALLADAQHAEHPQRRQGEEPAEQRRQRPCTGS